MDKKPDILSMWAYWNAIDDLSGSFERLAKKCKSQYPSTDSQKMWWEMYLGMHRCISEIRRNADNAFYEVEDDMYKHSFHPDQESITADEIHF